MATVSLIISIIALVCAYAAYTKSGGSAEEMKRKITLNLSMALGAIIAWGWAKYAPDSFERNYVTVASGFIGGEALIAGLILPILFHFGIIPTP